MGNGHPGRKLRAAHGPCLSGSLLAMIARSPISLVMCTPRTPLFSVMIACSRPLRKAMRRFAGAEAAAAHLKLAAVGFDQRQAGAVLPAKSGAHVTIRKRHEAPAVRHDALPVRPPEGAVHQTHGALAGFFHEHADALVAVHADELAVGDEQAHRLDGLHFHAHLGFIRADAGELAVGRARFGFDETVADVHRDTRRCC